MTEREPVDDWQLRDSGESGDQWQLLDTEQTLPESLTLQQDEDQAADWQPVEYEPEQSSGRRWFLPAFIIIALVAVVAYVIWLGLNNFGVAPVGVVDTAEPAPESAGEPAVVAVEPSPTLVQEEPTSTPLPTVAATPTVAPSPTPSLVEQLVGTIASQYGVNARSAPSTDSEALQVLEDGGRYVIADQTEDGWTQLLLEDGTTVWVSSEFVNVVSELVPVDVALAPVEEVATPQEITPETGAPSAVAVAGRVNVAAGTNLREEPSTDAIILQLLDDGVTISAIGRSADGDWLSVTAADGAEGWVFAQLVTLDGDVSSLPVAGDAAQERASDFITSDVVPPAPYTNTIAAGLAAIIVDTELGVNARTVPAADGDIIITIPEGAVVPASGRSGDSDWLQINLPNDVEAWVVASAVNVTDAVAQLPVVETTSVTETAPITDTTPLTATLAPTVTGTLTPVVTVSNLVGVTARVNPATDSDVATRVPGGGTELPAVGRSEDGDWVQVRLEDETLAWVFVGAIELNVDLQDLPVTE